MAYRAVKTDRRKNKKLKAVIKTKFGNIVIRLFPDIAPIHVKKFIYLVERNLYDGTTIHRVEKDFVIQGGCPHSKITKDNPDPENNPMLGEGSLESYALETEFSSEPHVKGTVSVPRDEDPKVDCTQFFICLDKNEKVSSLDKNFTVMGEVVDGMDAVNKIANVNTFAKPITDKFSIHRPVERIEIKIRMF